MKTTRIQTKLKRIEDLTLHEFDMVYSLSKIGWSYPEIGRRYGISESDVREVVDNYPELRATCERKPLQEELNRNPEPELTKKPRKRRSDAVYATPKQRQAAYRARLEERRHAGIEQPSPTADEHAPIPADEEFSVTGCQDPLTETSPENADPQSSTCYSSSLESDDIRESVPLPVTPEACSESEELRLIEEEDITTL